MIIIGEKLNSSIPSALKAFLSDNDDAIIEIIKAQADAGADYIDINTAMLPDEELRLIKTMGLVINNSNVGIVIDTVNMEIVRKALPYAKDRSVIINSISLSADVSALSGYDLSNISVIAMPTTDEGIPETPENRLINTHVLIDHLLAMGFREENIYADILIETTAVNQEAAITALNTLKLLKKKLPNIKTVCGASNISFGLPKRKYINASFIAMAIYNGLDAIISDIANPDIRGAILSSELLAGKDEYCMHYIDAMR